MCSNPDDFINRKEKLTLSLLTERIKRFSHGQKEFLCNYQDSFDISGGEPTLFPELFGTIKTINKFFPGVRISILSNGRMFVYEDYLKKLLDLKANINLTIPLHGPNAAIHDEITQCPGSFAQTIEGLKNILRFRKPKHFVEIRIVIHRLNYRLLRETANFIKNEFPQIESLVYIFFEIEGQAYKNLDKLKITYTQARPYVEQIYNDMPSPSKVRLYHFPLCTVPPKLFPFIWRTLPSYEVDFPKNCINCTLKKLCLGIHQGYLEHVGVSEFKPYKRQFSIQKDTNWHHPILNIRL